MPHNAAHGWSQAATGGTERLPEPRAEDFDALADLFLGPGEPGARAGSTADRRGIDPTPATDAPIELLVLGHLPVRAPLWARQYAWERAQTAPRPVALVRVAGGTLQVELLSPGLEPEEPLAEAGAALRQALAHAGLVLVRVDEPDEPRLAQWPGITGLTLLSGVDDAAVVAAYRAIKALGGDERDEAPSLRVAWMGCTSEAAAGAMGKLERACEAFLHRPLAFAGCASRIDGARGRVLFRGPMPEGTLVEDLLTRARSEAQREAERGTHAKGADASSGARADIENAPPRHGVLRLANDEDEVFADEPDAWAPPAAAGVAAPASATPASPVRDQMHRDAPESLAALIPGLTLLPARSPDAPEVELARGVQGELHLLVMDRGGGASALAAAAAWAARHGGLLALACPGLAQGSCDRARQHLVTLDAPSAASLLHTPIQVHLAVRAPGGWVLAPLNRTRPAL